MVGELLHAIVSWKTFLVALLVFGFAPGAVLRVIVLAFHPDDPRRREMLAELHRVPRLERPFWVVEQLEVALSEGILERVHRAVTGRSRTLRASQLWGIRENIPRRARQTLIAIGVITPLLAWWALTASQAVNPVFLPSPLDVLRATQELITSGELVADGRATLQRIALGFGLAILVSVPLGLLIGSFRAGEALFEPLLALLRYLPASAFIPLLLIWLGLGEPSKVGLLFIGTVFFNTLMTADVVRLVPRELIQVSYTLGANRREVLRKVIFPHALPGMIDAMRVNAAAAWSFVVVAELVASTSGLGYRIVRSQRFLQTDKIFAVLIVIGLMVLALDLSFRKLRDSVAGWAA